jgi:quercetin dioxygenase-like cupin family protein
MLGQIKETTGKPVLHPEAKEASVKVLVGSNEGWNHVMRVFELEVGGHTPKHAHDWPHINYILEGSGVLFLNGLENKVEAGSYAYIPSNELHQFRNVGNEVFKFICIVPSENHK